MKTFVINMDTPNGQVRLKQMKIECATAGLSFERIVGVDGMNSPMLDKVSQVCQTFCAPSMIGCALSHLTVWQRIVDDELDAALIFEDDARLVPNFNEKLSMAVSSVPSDYHVLLLGCFMCSPILQRLAGYSLKTDHSEEKNQYTRRISVFGGLHAYVVSQAGARYLLDKIKNVHYHIDVQLNNMKGLKMYTTIESLAEQGEGNATSSNVHVAFPGSVNTLFSKIKVSNGMTLDFFANTAIFRLGPVSHHIIITPMVLAFLILGIFGTPWKVVAGLSVLDTAFFLPNSARNTVEKLGAFALGLFIHFNIK